MEVKIFSATNALMENLFPDLFSYINSSSDDQCRIIKLSNFLLQNFIIHQGCYLLESALGEGFVPIPEQEFIPNQNIRHRTDYECFENHLHTSDLWKKHINGQQHLLAGIMIADNWRYKLKSTFPSVRFKIILSFLVLPIDTDDIYIRDDCVVRFHSVRTGEYWIDDNLDNYKHEAMGIIDI
jgi:hypothetical protein